MPLNFRGWGRYCPVLLSFLTLVLSGVLVLGAGIPVRRFAVSDANLSLLTPFETPDLDRNKAQAAWGQLPLRFEPNQGQTDSQVRFLARGAGYGLFLTPDQAVLSLRSPDRSASVVRMQLAGANPAARVSGADPLPGKSNYFIGNDPARWRRDIPQFARVRYQEVFPGVDLVYYGNQGQLEYDFEVAAGADPGKIALRFQAPERVHSDGAGDLILGAAGGEIRLKAPQIYQSSGEDRQTVAGRYLVRGDGEIGFELGSYDRSRVLVIDPVLTYSTYLGGTGIEACSAIAGVTIAGVLSPPPGCPAVAIDASANIYLAGSTTSADFPVVPPATSMPPAFQSKLAVAPDVFVTKLNAGGSAVLFSTYLGGDNVDTTAGVAVDTAFNVVVAGTTASSNFPVSTASAFQASRASGGEHAFVSQLDPAGENLLYSTYLSSKGTENARGLALDARNKIYVIGTTTSKDQPDATHSFPATLGAIQTASLGTSQFFVSKIDPTLIGLASLPYSTYFGGGNPIGGATLGGGIAVDANSNIYITGGTNFLHTGNPATDFPIVNAYQGCLDTPPTSTATANCSTSVTALDAFVAKINPSASSGAQLLYSTYLGGTGDDIGFGIAVDSGLSAYVTGSTTSTDFIIPTGTTPFQKCLDDPTNPATCPAGMSAADAFLGKLGNPCTGSTCTTTTVPLNYFSYLGGSDTDVGLAIVVDSLQGARIAGWTTSTNFHTTPNNMVQTTAKGATDAFVARIDTTASSAAALGHYGTYLGGGDRDFATSIAADILGNSYVAGETASGNFPTMGSPLQGALNGMSDAFLSKIGPTVKLVLTETVSPSPVGIGNNVTFTYSVVNNGDLLTGIIFTDQLPTSGATFVSADSSPGQSSCPATGGVVTCTVGTLNGGATATVRVVLTPTSAGSLSDGGRVTVVGTAGLVTPALSPFATVNDFSVAVAPATTTVAAGVPASYTVTVTPAGNIPETVTLSASGAPSGA
ncbi:MAG TPA: SBBP repeat-containing protein, partial [Terriglobales bacterium]|nr:SBBP repeat-containing protein [Terriglobales bacterium]